MSLDRNALARELADLGKSDAKLIAKLEKNRARRCELLTAAAKHPEAGLDAGVVAFSVEPKDQ